MEKGKTSNRTVWLCFANHSLWSIVSPARRTQGILLVGGTGAAVAAVAARSLLCRLSEGRRSQQRGAVWIPPLRQPWGCRLAAPSWVC